MLYDMKGAHAFNESIFSGGGWKASETNILYISHKGTASYIIIIAQQGTEGLASQDISLDVQMVLH